MDANNTNLSPQKHNAHTQQSRHGDLSKGSTLPLRRFFSEGAFVLEAGNLNVSFNVLLEEKSILKLFGLR